jgi:Bacterial extracellular solute-binding protein
MQMSFVLLVAAAILVAATAQCGAATEQKLFAPGGIWNVLKDIGSQFERSSSHKLSVTMDTAARLAERIESNERVDIFLSPPTQMGEVTPPSIAILTLKGRMLNPAVETFIQRLRDAAMPMKALTKARK